MTSIIKQHIFGEETAALYLSCFDTESAFKHQCLRFEPYNFSRQVCNGWNVKISDRVLSTANALIERSEGNEVGGAIMGFTDYRNKIIYVTRTIVDDKYSSNSAEIVMGSSDQATVIENVMKRTGSIIRYMGDWHSHPQGSLKLSITDERQISKLKRELDDPFILSIVFNESSFKSHITE